MQASNRIIGADSGNGLVWSIIGAALGIVITGIAADWVAGIGRARGANSTIAVRSGTKENVIIDGLIPINKVFGRGAIPHL